MKEYHKIQTVFLRDPATNFKTLLEGQFASPEFEFLAGNEWVFTEKVDGTNIRIIRKDGVITLGGKTDNAQIPATLVSALRALSDGFPSDAIEGDFCLYGEGYGTRIQKCGVKYRADQSFVLFDVQIGDFWLNRDAVEDIARKLGLSAVPIIGAGTLHEMVEIARRGIRSEWGDFDAEGIVARPRIELKTRSGARLITKIKTRDFARD